MAQAGADVVDSDRTEPLPSSLNVPQNKVAQALWLVPSYRGLSASELASRLAVRTVDARGGMAAMVAMANDIARGTSRPALRHDASLQGAIADGTTLDQALARYGSHMGPIVRVPAPRFSRQQDWGAGAIDASLESATKEMVDFLTSNGCGPSPAGIVGNFQAAYNSAYNGNLAIDDEYGKLTRAATAKVLSDSQNVSDGETLPNELTGYTAPPACSYGTSRAIVPAAPTTPTTMPTVVVTGTPPTAAPMQAGLLPKTPWGWALLAGAAAVVALANQKHPPKWTPRALRFRGKR